MTYRYLENLDKFYTVAGQRKRYTLNEAIALANRIAAETGIIVAIEGVR